MQRIAWITDLHLNFVDENEIRAFLRTVSDANPDAVLIGGDITDAPHLIAMLRTIEAGLRRPIYFVLGNHDYYHGSIAGVRRAVRELAARSEHLTYLPAAGVVPLGDETALVGHGGWGDGRLGDFKNSWVILNDFLLIEELTGIPPADPLCRLNALGDEAGAYLAETLPLGFATRRRVVVLTHVPPFKETCWHKGQISDDNFLPHFTCKAAGDALLDVMAHQPADKEMLVLCGHTHGAGQAQIRTNLRVLTGGADYGAPTIQRLFDIG